MSKYVWTLVEGPVDCEEDEDEYNPAGLWLGNKETNQVFILPKDFETVRALLNASAPVPVAAPEKRCKCGHLPAEHSLRYATPYPCVPGKACLCGFVRTPGE